MKIAFDVDGVLADFSGAAIEAMRRRGILLPKDYVHTVWHFADVLANGEWHEIFHGMLLAEENFWMKLSPLQDNVDALREYIERHGDDEVFYITARPPSNGADTTVQTQLWLHNLGLGSIGAKVIVTENKRDAIIEHDIKFFVDDLNPTIEDCQDIPGHKAFVLDTTYNRLRCRLPRVHSVEEFLLEVESAG